MPFISLKVTERLNKEQKEKIAQEFSDTLLRIAGKPKESTYLVIDETAEDNLISEDEKFSQRQAAFLEESIYFFTRD